MDKLLVTLRTCFIPLLLLGLSLPALIRDPDKPILKSVPIFPGAYQYELAATFAVAGLLLSYLVRRHEKRRLAGPDR